MSFTEKVDVLDLLVNILREHEEKLDELVSRLEAVAPNPNADREGHVMGHPIEPPEKPDWR